MDSDSWTRLFTSSRRYQPRSGQYYDIHNLGEEYDDIITTPLFVPLGMLNATSPTDITCAFVSFSVVSTGCFRAARFTPIRISSSKVPYPYTQIIE